MRKLLIEIKGEKLTCDEALKNMAYYFGDDEGKYEIYKSARKKAKEYIKGLFQSERSGVFVTD